MLLVVALLGYPMALLFGLPLAQRDIDDLRKWVKETLVAQAPLELPAAAIDGGEIRFGEGDGAVLVRQGIALGLAAELADTRFAPDEVVVTSEPFERLSATLFRSATPLAADDPLQALYADGLLQAAGSVLAEERPDGQRLDFSFAVGQGPVVVDDRFLADGVDYLGEGTRVVFATPPPFGSSVRRVSGDYLILDADAGTVLFATPPGGEVVAAEATLRLAERLEGSADGSNRRFSLRGANVLDGDDTRRLYLDARLLSAAEERPDARVDGERTTFAFDSPPGVVTLAGRPLVAGRDYRLDGVGIVFPAAPARNVRLRNHPDYALIDPAAGDILLAHAPSAGALLWAESYTVNARPGCGSGLLECFFNLPQHPVPFPHWIVGRIAPFFGKYALGDERNVLSATLYTTLGTLSALVLGAAFGIALAVVFVLFRPLERALLPWVIASQTVPIIALVPVLLLVLGNFGITIQTSLLPTAIIGAYIAFFPVVVGTVKGLRSVDPLALDLMRSYAASPLQMFGKVRFPAAAPFLFTSLKLGTAAALVGALVAETESNNRRGLGFQILGQVQSGNVADVWILLILSGLLGVALVALVGLLERLFAPWRHPR